MNFGSNNQVYIIIELSNNVPFANNNFKIIGAAYSLDVADKYRGPNRIIQGPIPIFENNPFKPNIFFPTQEYDFGIPKPKFNFSDSMDLS
jgi:hypothetical protein